MYYSILILLFVCINTSQKLWKDNHGLFLLLRILMFFIINLFSAIGHNYSMTKAQVLILLSVGYTTDKTKSKRWSDNNKRFTQFSLITSVIATVNIPQAKDGCLYNCFNVQTYLWGESVWNASVYIVSWHWPARMTLIFSQGDFRQTYSES